VGLMKLEETKLVLFGIGSNHRRKPIINQKSGEIFQQHL